MSVAQPDYPAVSDYPTAGPHAALLDAGHALFLAELASNEGWEDAGEREEVQLYRKADPTDAYAVPTVKGECLVTGCTSDDFLAVLQLSGFRKRWDPRFESGHMLQRYSQNSYAFHSEMKGFGWLVYPRDIVGIQKNYRSSGKNEEILIVQTSVEEPELAPEQSGKTRATLTISGWQLLPQGDDLKVTYVVRIALNGSMPLQMVNMIATETPLCTGRARDVYYEMGHAPYVVSSPGQTESSVTFQNEIFSDPGVGAGNKGDLIYRCSFTTVVGGTFEVVYDKKKMYTGGVDVVIEGEGATAVDDGAGGVKVSCEKGGETVTLVISPK